MKMMNSWKSAVSPSQSLWMLGIVVPGIMLLSTPAAEAQRNADRGAQTIDRESDSSSGRRPQSPTQLVDLNWQVIPQILSSIPTIVGDGFGSSCAMNEDGTVFVVGASDATVNEIPAVGAVHIFRYSDLVHAWEHVQKLECPPTILAGTTVVPPGLSLFGWSVAISGNTIVVGAPVVSTALVQLAGKAYVFQLNEADNLWGKVVLEQRMPHKVLGPLTPGAMTPAAESIGFFGGSVAVDVVSDTDTRIIVGSPFKGEANQGGVYVFEGSGSIFTQKAFLIPEDVVGQDNFGTKVAIDGNVLVVGSQLADSDDLLNVGSALIYRRSAGPAGVWAWEAALTRESSVTDDGFGSAVSIVGDTIAVGAPGTDFDAHGDTSANEGSAFLYRFTAGLWVRDGEVYAREANAANAFGYALALAAGGNELIVGAPGYESTAPLRVNAGAGFAFTRSGVADWDLHATDLWTPTALASQGIGEQVAVSGDGLKAALGSRHNVSGGIGSVQLPTNMFGWTSGLSPIAGGTVTVGSIAPTQAAPGAGAYGEGTITTGTGSGGTTPSTGGFGNAAIAIPAIPSMEEWGVVQASVIAVNRAISRISIILTDGNGQLETNGKSTHFLGDFDPSWTVLGLGDVNGDGSSDVLFSTPNRKVKAWIRLGHRIVGDTVTVGTHSVGDRFMGISDWTGNGFDGPAFLHADGHSGVFWVVQGGAVTEKIEWELGEGDWTFRTADVNDDDRPDLIARDAAANRLLKVVLSASREVSLVDIVNPGPKSTIAAVHDFDGNGSADFLWRDQSTDELEFFFLNSDGTVRFQTPWDSNLPGWTIDSGSSFATSGSGLIFSKGGSEVLILTVRFEAIQTLPAGRGNIRVDYSRVVGELEDGYEILGPAEEP